jgi:peptidoglycan/xylan/chitin deacetylase (PgdA/CDA1 family)
MMARAAREMMKGTAAIADSFRPPPRGLVVLIYHRVGARTGIEVDLPIAVFEDQIAWLAATVPVVSLDEGLSWLEGDEDPASVAESDDLRVAITFDDGTADFADAAVPVLARYGVPATLYVATEFVDAQNPFPFDGVPITWAALRDTLDSGVITIGSHTHTHALLDRLPADAVPDELDRSIDLIGTHLGVKADHFAYPKAVAGSSAAETAVRARFVSAALAGGRVNRRGAADVHRLARTPVQVSDSEIWFRRKARGGLALEETMRRLMNRVRYAEATT